MIISRQTSIVPLQLETDRCPFCKVATPNLQLEAGFATANASRTWSREWGFYHCSRCGGVVTAAWTPSEWGSEYAGLAGIYPADEALETSIDPIAREFLRQCKDSLHAPSGAIMLAASAVDAMLKAKGYKDGSLYQRIQLASDEHIITKDMSKWAHQVRLDANDQRHSDEGAGLPTTEDAQRSLDFSLALAEILFVLPARVTRGLSQNEQGASAG